MDREIKGDSKDKLENETNCGLTLINEIEIFNCYLRDRGLTEKYKPYREKANPEL